MTRRATAAAFPIALTVFAMLFFARSFTSYFVADDFFFLNRVDFARVTHYFSQSLGYGNEYRPVVAYAFAINAAVSGMSPLGYHVVNTLIHLLNAGLVGLLALQAGVAKRVSVLASFIFLLNPVAHECVLWVSGRPGLMGSCLVLASSCCFVRAWHTPKAASSV